MSKEKNQTQNLEPTPALSKTQLLMQKASKVQDLPCEKYFGHSPSDLEIPESSITKLESIRDIIDVEVTIFGYKKLTGKKDEFFFLIFGTMMTKDNDIMFFHFTCGGEVIMKKLASSAEAKMLPLLCTFYERESDKYTYYDIK